ncbi:hypothetical protein C8T65DRAFT_825010 [Cerioporus squamosus]|nr:hypothetical protein C8T65DRAFT_825010 [Cerioporus squamosus]
MDQNWVAVDLDERACLRSGGKLSELFWSDSESIIDALRLPSTDETIDYILEGRSAVQHSPLFLLPPELLDQIFQEINISSGTYDARLVLIALTCKALLACARRHIVRLQTRRHAPLAGHRLVCIGEGATALEDYRPGVLAPTDVKILRTPYWDTPVQADEADDGEADNLSLYAHATTRCFRCSFQVSGLSTPSSLLDLIYRPSAVSRMSMEDFVRFQALTAPSHGVAGADTSQGPPWALCNLTKREYVYADHSDASITLWQMLLACICWTSCRRGSETAANSSEQCGAALCRGRWAGDRFAIRTLDSTWTGTGWSDATCEVSRLVKNLQARCGG